MNYYTRERLGPKRSLTKEGWLLCEATPIARTGDMLYGAHEIAADLVADSEGFITVTRTPEEVFRPETIASFNGKDLVDEHPDRDVTPANWRGLTCGVVMNARRGTGAEDDLLLADLLVKDAGVIRAINEDNKREVSCGYDADYLMLFAADGKTPLPGRAKQVNILGNHVALVVEGRCGSRCAIGDSNKELTMSWIDKVKAAFAGKDEAAFNAALAEAPKGETISLTTAQLKALNKLTTDAMHGKECDCAECKAKYTKDGLTKDAVVDAVFADKRFTDVADNVKRIVDAFEKEDKEDEDDDDKTDDDNTKILGELELEAPPGTGDGIAAKSKDSALLADSWQETLSLAEVISPGAKPASTFDAKADPKKTYDAMCRFRHTVLDLAATQPATRTFMDGVTGGRGHATLDCAATRSLFRAVGAFKKQANNNDATRDMGLRNTPTMAGGGSGAVGAIQTPADLNKKFAEIYKTAQ
jgi:hypothetical protein